LVFLCYSLSKAFLNTSLMQATPQFDFLSGETIAVNKPYGWTSFDVVNKIRSDIKQNLGIKKLRIGHAGTLDPLASGLLILCSGKNTKLIESIQELEKEYTGTFRLGATTPSFDLETEIDRTYPFEHISLESVRKAVMPLTGEIMQVPPIYSAIKIGGRRAFEAARKKEVLLLQPRKVMVHAFEITLFNLPDVSFRIICSKGTYIRSLVRDLGLMLGSGSHLLALERTRIGHYSLNEAYCVDELYKLIVNMGSANW